MDHPTPGNTLSSWGNRLIRSRGLDLLRLRIGRYRLMPALLILAVMLSGNAMPALFGAPASPVLPPLTTISGSPRLPGKFVWADLVTDDLPAAQKFYSAMFGWKFYMVGDYSIAISIDRPLAGMFQRPRPKDRPAQPRWFGYISVGSVGAAQKTVNKLGGRTLAAPQKFPKRGEQAVFADPEGAVFGVIKSSIGDPEDFLPEPGEWVWVQLLSRDASKAAEFYRAIAHYDVVANTTTNRLSDYVLLSEGYARATVRNIPSGNTNVQPTWLPFVRVKNIGESVTRAKQLGGNVRVESNPELFAGKVAVIADPTGAAVGLLEWSPEALKGGPLK